MSVEPPVSEGRLRRCFREPVPSIFAAARLLDEAVTAHLRGDRVTAASRLREADLPEVRAWCESLWGANSPYVQARAIESAPAHLEIPAKASRRMPAADQCRRLIQRDGYHCRFCGIPVIRREIRERVRKSYPEVAMWGRCNRDQHAAFQTMWLQYDHLLPHARGGDNSDDNLVITCAPCNFARMDFTLEEVGVENPLAYARVESEWDGLERFIE